ncbi:MAG: hypothetical protein M3Y71_01890 [Actinomycetota bacterium]|nr:hypothetical protein [Actinomycetota bacterium]
MSAPPTNAGRLSDTGRATVAVATLGTLAAMLSYTAPLGALPASPTTSPQGLRRSRGSSAR